jgi:hypothetical protein
MTLTTHPLSAPGSNMDRPVSPPPIYACLTCDGTTVPLFLNLSLLNNKFNKMYLRTVEFDGVSFATVLGVSAMFLQLGCIYLQWKDTCGFCPLDMFLKCNESLFQDVGMRMVW